MNTFATFERFTNENMAKEFAEQLAAAGIPVEVEDNSKIFDPSFTTNTIAQKEINVKVQSKNFEKVHQVLADIYKQHISAVPADYYLYEFTDRELIEILSKPDEWGAFDYQLAQHLLKDRGLEIDRETAMSLKDQRLDHLSKPEKAQTYWVVLGYVCALLGGVFGFLVGWSLTSSKKTLPDGQRVYMYRKEERNHGKRILVLSTVCLIVWLVMKWNYDMLE